MSNPLPSSGPERELMVSALSIYSDDCEAPSLTPDCPFYVETGAGPSCAEECKDLLGKVRGGQFDRPTFEAPDGLAFFRRRRRAPRPRRGPADHERPFDAREQYFTDKDHPFDSRTVPSLVHELMATLPFRVHVERWHQHVNDVVNELARRGIDAEGLVRGGLHEGVLMAVVFQAVLADMDHEGELMMDEVAHSWKVLLTESHKYDRARDQHGLVQVEAFQRRMRYIAHTMGPSEGQLSLEEDADTSTHDTPLVIYALAGMFVDRVESWICSASFGELLDLTPPTLEAFLNPPVPALDDERLETGAWLADRFIYGFLGDWRDESLRREWLWHMGTCEGGAPPGVMRQRATQGPAISAEVATRHCNTRNGAPAAIEGAESGKDYAGFVTSAAESLKAGRRDEAITTFRVLQRLDPNHADLNNNLGFCLIPTNPEAARHWLLRAQRLAGSLGDGTTLANLVLVDVALGDYRHALELAEKFQHNEQLGQRGAFLWGRTGEGEYELLVDEVPRVYAAELAAEAAVQVGDMAAKEIWARRTQQWAERARANRPV